jgi:hypothetical protein
VPRHTLLANATAAVISLLAPSIVLAASLRATGTSQVYANSVEATPAEALVPEPDSLTFTVAAAASDEVVNNQQPPDPERWAIVAIAGASGVARYGLLTGRAHAEASSLPGNPVYPARASVQVRPGYTDGGQVLSDTLAPGTPVTLTFHMTLVGSRAYFVDGPELYPPSGGGAAHRVEVRDLDDFLTEPVRGELILGEGPTGPLTLEFSTAVGHRVEIAADLTVGARIDIFNAGVFYYSQGTYDAVAETAEVFFEPSGDVRLETASGHDYTVPEPIGQVWSALCALVLLSRRGRRSGHADVVPDSTSRANSRGLA